MKDSVKKNQKFRLYLEYFLSTNTYPILVQRVERSSETLLPKYILLDHIDWIDYH